MASCVCGYHVYGGNWIYSSPKRRAFIVSKGIGNVIDQHAVAVKLTVRFAAAMARDGIELENVPQGLGKV